MTTYRIHGDNIVECERIANIIIKTLNPKKIYSKLVSPSTVALIIEATYLDNDIHWCLELLPGFNKNTKKRWSGNIFDALKEAGSFFDETPDAIISVVENAVNERILLGIEFCSALQAGNQAWQRSARAFSTGRAGCPYIYIVDFVKYELDNETRERKSLRFPNAAVPYSYVNYSKNTGNFVAQLYAKSEEFDRSKDVSIKDFNEDDFGSKELGIYIVKKLLGLDTQLEEAAILNKNMNVVKFLAKKSDDTINYTADEWQEIYDLVGEVIVDFAVYGKRFGFHKTIATKSHHGHSKDVIKLIDKLSVGFASRDLPFGIIPAKKRAAFAKSLSKLYPNSDDAVINAIGNDKSHLIIAIFKGFKPRGDDNRPDRGLLPFAAMLSASDVDVMTYIYGPMLETNLKLLDSQPLKLADSNGLWRSILALSNFVAIDVPVLSSKKYDAERIYDTTAIKSHFADIGVKKAIEPAPCFPAVPVNYGEDDVDTAIHYLFTHILGHVSFEGMCNPPGGDWSGFSVIYENCENRWLSLPRVSDVVSGKRPDHILEIFGVFDKPLLLSVESKEKSSDLETDVGIKLITYMKRLMDYVPSAKRKIFPEPTEWQWGNKKVPFSSFETISAAAYLKKYAEPAVSVFAKKCEVLFVTNPIMTGEKIGWEIEIIPSTKRSKTLKEFILHNYSTTGNSEFFFK